LAAAEGRAMNFMLRTEIQFAGTAKHLRASSPWYKYESAAIKQLLVVGFFAFFALPWASSTFAPYAPFFGQTKRR